MLMIWDAIKIIFEEVRSCLDLKDNALSGIVVLSLKRYLLPI